MNVKPTTATKYEEKKIHSGSDDEFNQVLKAQLQKEFFKAVRKGDSEVCKKYIERFNINVNSQNELGDTALIIASQQSNFKLIHMLMNLGADQTIKNKTGKLPSDYSFRIVKTDVRDGERIKDF